MWFDKVISKWGASELRNKRNWICCEYGLISLIHDLAIDDCCEYSGIVVAFQPRVLCVSQSSGKFLHRNKDIKSVFLMLLFLKCPCCRS